jgi:hypothetical protein
MGGLIYVDKHLVLVIFIVTVNYTVNKRKYEHTVYIQLFQLRLSPSKAEKLNTSTKGCWESLINSSIY